MSEAQERFLILARRMGPAAERLREILQLLGRVEVIVDQVSAEGRDSDGEASGKCSGVHVTNEEASGFAGLMSSSGPFPPVTAWSRALAHLAATSQPGEAVWFVEDDVAGDAMSFAELVNGTAAEGADLAAIDIRSRRQDGNWYYWNYTDGFFDEPWRSFQPLCRVSGRLLEAILEFQKRHGRFTFHEVLFASLARQEGMPCLSWNDDGRFRHLFTTFRYRPEVREVARGISHPVKDEEMHRRICHIGGPGECLPWHEQELDKWKQLFFTDSPVRVLETGIGDGTGARLLLDEIFTHPLSEVHGVHDHDGESGGEPLERFQAAGEGRNAGQLHFYEGASCEILAWMIAGDGFWESFDFIHLNGGGDATVFLTEACQAWHLLKAGGLVIFGEKADHIGVSAFLTAFQQRAERRFIGRRLAVRKNP